MTVTVSSFRTAFAAFASTTTYPDPLVQMWMDFCAKLINAERWGDLYDMGVQLMLAHFLSMEQKAAIAAQTGQPGGGAGVMTSKSAGGLSVSYDVSSVMEPDAGHWNQTTYGMRYIRLSRMMGAGPLQLGADVTSTSASVAWPGPAWVWF